jgi:hypothetical protein
VAWTLTETLEKRETTTTAYLWFSDPQNSAWTPLYAHPPRREWRGLDKDETMHLMNDTAGGYWADEAHIQRFARAIEAALKERNA